MNNFNQLKPAMVLLLALLALAGSRRCRRPHQGYRGG